MAKMPPPALPKNLKVIRGIYNLSQKEMAGKIAEQLKADPRTMHCSLTVKAYAKYEEGRQSPNIYTTEKILQLFPEIISLATLLHENLEDYYNRIMEFNNRKQNVA